MFGWFRSPPVCPIDSAIRQWVDDRWEWLTEQFGLERLRSCRVILPRAEFFPDPYQGTDDDVRRMLNRVCGYMGIDPASVELSLYEDRKPVFEGEWSHGTAGLYHPEGAKFQIWVNAKNVLDPLAIVATMAHELGHVHLLGHQRISNEAEDHEPLTDLLTVFLGLGVFNANSVIREHSWNEGNWSGWSIARLGYLDMPVYGYAFAKFAMSRDEDGVGWARELRLAVRTDFQSSLRLLKAEAAVANGVVVPPTR